MAKITIPCLVGKTNKAGVTNWYWQPSATLARAGWRPLSLGQDEWKAVAAARARNDEVEQWRNGGAKPREIKAPVQPSTFAALIDRYRRERVEGKKPNGQPLLRPKTRAVYETSLKRLEAWAGKHPVSYITPLRVKALKDANATTVEMGGLGHAAAFNLLRQLRQVLDFAESIELIPKGSNPATDFDLGAPPPRRQVWEADDEAAFIAAAYKLGKPSMALAIELGLYTAQREGDLIGMTEPQVQELDLFDPVLVQRLAGKDGKVRGWCFNQTKTSNDQYEVRMEIPFEPTILVKVEAAIRANRARDRAADPPRLLTHVLIDDDTGKPWKQRHFISTYRRIIDEAVKHTGRTGMEDLVWHDLRRTRVVRLRRRGMPMEMIASITGHSLQAIKEMLKVYGPVDATITAQAIAGTLPPQEPEQAETNEQSA
ncbi:tyrosine-type recombinase/integrase [Novosphingobium sp. FKTRR1]|uniref:tyrosine-type recombinase/integrase n=1 Tax=Novosphingobium sp. FKTRR1 TaxID=2879118 RepID=UPI001CF08D67|nr:tyrosine-type recombinase/integrase [Novosphingobium sp. FKTRR1]